MKHILGIILKSLTSRLFLSSLFDHLFRASLAERSFWNITASLRRHTHTQEHQSIGEAPSAPFLPVGSVRILLVWSSRVEAKLFFFISNFFRNLKKTTTAFNSYHNICFKASPMFSLEERMIILQFVSSFIDCKRQKLPSLNTPT